MKEMTWKSRLNRLFAHRFALPVLCWCAALVFWLVQGAVAFAGDSSAKAKGTLTETSIPIESWQLAELTWGEPGENSAPQGPADYHRRRPADDFGGCIRPRGAYRELQRGV